MIHTCYEFQISASALNRKSAMTEGSILFGHDLIVKEGKAIHPLVFHWYTVLRVRAQYCSQRLNNQAVYS